MDACTARLKEAAWTGVAAADVNVASGASETHSDENRLMFSPRSCCIKEFQTVSFKSW